MFGVLTFGCAGTDTAQTIDPDTSAEREVTVPGTVLTTTPTTIASTTIAPTTRLATTTTTAVATSTTAVATSMSTTTTSTSSTTTSTTTVAPTESPDVRPPIPPVPPITPYPIDSVPFDQETTVGTSVQGRAITVIRRGTAGGTRVLLIGAIHGNEDAGVAIIEHLRTAPIPDGVELWMVPSINPDGQAMRIRHNANGVDLNRNFPHKWDWLAEPGNWQYGGAGPASEPEVQAMVSLASINPDLTLWYHQDLFRISPSTGRDGAVRQRYADLTALPVVEVTGGTYTGTASQWSRTIAAVDGIGFTVELGDTLPPDDAIRHADAVLTVATEL